ncbi:CHC2 zinc finger domain-containing protein [Dickeya dianthicola]|uniref:DNA primase n=2 Tax=Dickeya dianthicola TaxID=204039 RepID=A0AAX1C0K7_9GAMM|nr:CHC2 zinc finger domain-containing protein [Dickeya dianthicola]MCI4005020.1 CHC2 zinc finger domain-containing protein [Dickeya dianthicola]MZG45484.1 toprim domain-containing protein [Dickeya dianthicola]PWD68745.1 DNA primase [Dickeya dianthicola]
MGRMTPAELEQLKRGVSLRAVAQSQGHTLKKQGADSYVCRCPFHQENTPSCVITPSKNLYHCFGCGASGSVLDWLQHTERLTYPQTLLRLRELAGTASSLAAVPVPASPAVARTRLADLDDDGQALLNQVIQFYHQSLLASPEAQQWLAGRGLTHPELVSHFRLGFAGHHGIGGSAGLLPSSSSQEGKRLREKLAGLGVLRSATKQDHFRGCVVMPVIGWSESANVAQRGRVMQLYGRRVQPDHKILKGSPKHLYLPSPLAGVWNEEALKASSDIILCESLIDAMTFWCAGFRNVTTAYGANGFTADHLAALQYHGVKRVQIAYDRDEAGDRGADSVAADLLECGIEAWRVRFPPGLDANAYALNSGSPESALGLALEQAAWMGNGSGPGVVFRADAGVNGESEPSSLAAPAGVPAPTVAGELTASGDLLLTHGPRVWRVRGWQKNTVQDVMKVNVQVRDESTGALYVDSLDLYSSRQRQGYVSAAAAELGCEASVIKRECGRVLLMLEQKQDALRQSAEQADNVASVTVSAEDEAAALELLTSPDLAARIVDDLAACGVVGESTNLLTGYLAATSRKLDKPLAVLIQSSSAAGKSSLMDAVLGMMPEEERIQYSAMTGQSLYYLGETSLQHKILAIAEEEGVRQAAYALKLLQSDGELKIASTGKNEQSGELVTREYKVQGPVMLMLTTTASDVDEELLNRCLVLTVNESREQTQAIHAMQRHGQTLAGLLQSSEKQYLTRLHQNAQRLLRPLKVVNPYADRLTFLSDKTRTRRDHMKYLTLIQAIALLHQYQREVKRVTHRGQVIEYIEVEKSDIALANQLAHEVLGRTLDEMPPQTRKLLVWLKGWVQETAQGQAVKADEIRFTRRDVRSSLGWGDTQLKIHLGRLLEMEYLLLFRRGLTYEYGLLWDGDDNGGAHLCGLLEVEDATPETGDNADRSGLEVAQSAPGRGVVGSRSVGEKPASGQTAQGSDTEPVGVTPDVVIRGKEKSPAVPLPASKNGVAEGNADRSGLDAAQSAPGRGVVGSRSESEKPASGQTAQGLTAEPVGAGSDAVIRGKGRSPAAPLPVAGKTGVTHG